jgi:hypothetical protein
MATSGDSRSAMALVWEGRGYHKCAVWVTCDLRRLRHTDSDQAFMQIIGAGLARTARAKPGCFHSPILICRPFVAKKRQRTRRAGDGVCLALGPTREIPRQGAVIETRSRRRTLDTPRSNPVGIGFLFDIVRVSRSRETCETQHQPHARSTHGMSRWLAQASHSDSSSCNCSCLLAARSKVT